MGNIKHNRLIHTGGTFSMGYDDAGALVPMYDSRHSLLAMKILDLAWDTTQQQMLFRQLVETRDLLLKHSTKETDEALEDALESIAAQIGIITGGEVSLASVMQEYRVHPSRHEPYMIDGIDFCLREHYPLLKKQVMACIDAGDIPVITLGADTLHMIAPMLAKDLARHNVLQKHTVIFVASMVAFGEDPHHIGRLLQAAMELATHEMPGAFALCATGRMADKIEVHDVLSGFTKISATVPHAFVSEQVIAVLSCEHGFVLQHMAYQPRSCALPTSNHEALAYVAPPLRLSRTLHEALHYLALFPNIHVLIELTKEVEANAIDIARLKHMVSERACRGIATMVLNPLQYNATEGLTPCLPATEWHNAPWIQALLQSGGAVKTAMTLQEAYSNAVLGLGAVESLEAKDRLRRAYGIVVGAATAPPPSWEAKPIQMLEIHYIPDAEMMEHAMSAAENIAHVVQIVDLPGGVMPARHVQTLRDIILHGHDLCLPEAPMANEISAGKNKRLYAAAHAFTQFVDRLPAAHAT